MKKSKEPRPKSAGSGDGKGDEVRISIIGTTSN